MAKIGKFSGKYGLFLSDASNEEIVSVSKELMNGVSSEIKSVNSTAIGILGVSLLSTIFLITFIAAADVSVTGLLKAIVFLTRILSVALLCISAIFAGLVIGKASDASSISSLLWRNVRENTSDEMAYEQIQAVRVTGKLLTSSKALVKMAALTVAVATALLAVGFILEMLSAYSYI